MSHSRHSLEASLRALGKARDDHGLEHPEPQQIVAYHVGTLSELERERIQDHLAECPSCVEAVLDLARFPRNEIKDPSQQISDEDLDRSLQLLRERINRDEAGGQTVPIATPAEKPRRSVRWPHLLAAMLGLTCLGSLFRVHQLELEVDRLDAPRGDADLVWVDPENEQRSSEPEPILLTEDGNPLLLLLKGYESDSFDTYDAEIWSDDGTQLDGPISLASEPGSPKTIWFPRSPDAEVYRIVLYGSRQGRREAIRTYRLQIVHQ